MQRVSQGHIAMPMMVTVGLTIGSDVHELWPILIFGVAAHQPVGKDLAIGKQPFESHGARNRPVIKEEVDLLPRRQPLQMRLLGINAGSGYVLPLGILRFAFWLQRT